MPMIEKNFQVSAKPDDRAVAGLSMGGGQTRTSPSASPSSCYVVAMCPPLTASRQSGDLQGADREQAVQAVLDGRREGRHAGGRRSRRWTPP
jgi:enterochelin esterase-like enzyme